MARPKKSDSVDLTRAHDLTLGLIERLACPPDRQQAFMRDSMSPGLRVRVTAAGAKSFVFEAKLNRQTIRRTIGDVRAWTIAAARQEANRLRVTLDQGNDPRELERQRRADQEAAALKEAAESTLVAEIWPRYVAEGRPKRKDAWKPRYVADMALMVSPGGQPKKRGTGKTLPGHLFPLMALPLSAVTEDVLTQWFQAESVRSKHQAARALMMFRGFLRWCAARPEYRSLVDRDAGRAAAIVEALPSTTRRTDALEAAQVCNWWTEVERLPNRTASAYLRALLLTGARREEMAALRWSDVDFKWRRLTIADKVDATRTIPLGPYLGALLANLPRGQDAHGLPSPFVFASSGKSGRIADPRASHARVLEAAGIARLTFHGLRRSFSLLGEAAGAPAGALGQLMGHKPSGVAEGYRPRSVDGLRPYLEQVEAHILGLAGVSPGAVPAVGPLRLVAKNAA